jgi:hypothetical protein
MNINEITQEDLDQIEAQLKEKIDNEEQLKPLFEKLHGRDDIYSAIMSDKLDKEITAAILDGSLTPKQIDKVEKDTGLDINAVAEMVRAEIDKKIGAGIGNVTEDIEAMKLAQEVRDFSESVPDYDAFREGIADWYDSHEGMDGMPIMDVYKLVKFDKMTEEAKSAAEAEAVEEAKKMAAMGGNGAGTGKPGSSEDFASAILGFAKGMR